ncbi:hypothetical protein [Sphingobium scionense]|uniref:Uncharacterized protein n=1 Tax=Sphingobium scionense TaxID=1404341 RepID=A0A7W6PXM2_9SPHN|nr:hypothetical protein [Sphingobium scionense]MBB4149115.1 hypothetical protein [Sphingobium scionense]
MATNDRASPRPSIPESLENASHALDRLIHDALLPHRGRHDDRLANLEERARAIAASIVAPFERKAALSADAGQQVRSLVLKESP